MVIKTFQEHLFWTYNASIYMFVVIIACLEILSLYETMQVLRTAMKGLGTDDTTLIRVIVTRTEMDMQYIKAEYLRKYKKTLNDAVHSETSGHYRTFLLSLLGPNHQVKGCEYGLLKYFEVKLSVNNGTGTQ